MCGHSPRGAGALRPRKARRVVFESPGAILHNRQHMSLTAQLVGNDHTIARLRGEAEAGTLPHALLLTGPDGVGKTTTAITLSVAALRAHDWPGGATTHPDLWIEDSSAENI